jgi:RNA recognition motif-containing protein
MHIQIMNLNLGVIEADIRRLFTPFGEVAMVEVDRDKWNHRSTGRAFVNMPVEKQARTAILTLNGTMVAGKAIAVTALNPVWESKNF